MINERWIENYLARNVAPKCIFLNLKSIRIFVDIMLEGKVDISYKFSNKNLWWP